jgi:hypothetical protein
MATVTGGKVTYKRSVQPQPYESKSAEVEFSFSLTDGDEQESLNEDTAELLRTAQDLVLKSLGLRKQSTER